MRSAIYTQATPAGFSEVPRKETFMLRKLWVMTRTSVRFPVILRNRAGSRLKSALFGRLAGLLLAVWGYGCHERPQDAGGGAGAGPLWFEDITAKAGLDFVHDPGPLGRFFMPETVGSGAALFDFDNDGRLDIYLVQNAGPNSKSTNKLFRQGKDGKLTDVSKGSGLDVAGFGMGVAIGDINNDGFADVLLTQYGGVRLFLNNGNGTFTEITKEAGLEYSQWAVSAAFFDYDRDGRLDLVVANYIDYLETEKCYDRAGKPEYCGPNSRPGTVSRLFHNLGPPAGSQKGVRFEDVTVKSGLGALPGPGLGVVCADFDGDGWPDIFIANDAKPNCLWMNQHDGTFKNEAAQRGIAYNALGAAEANMGIALGDVDGDGLFDIFVTHLTEENNTFWKQGPPGLFQDSTALAGLAHPDWHATGFGVALADFDQDGFPDLAVVNGRVRRSNQTQGMEAVLPALGPYWSRYGERCQLFRNEGTGRFRDVSQQNAGFCGSPLVGRGLAWGDIDGDGAVDLLVTAIAGPARLWRNVIPNRGHWLMVKAIEPALGGRDAYGATVLVRAGGRMRSGWINPGSSYECSSDPRAHFGLGRELRVEAIQVLWPEGEKEGFPGTAADQVIVLRKGEGKPAN